MLVYERECKAVYFDMNKLSCNIKLIKDDVDKMVKVIRVDDGVYNIALRKKHF